MTTSPNTFEFDKTQQDHKGLLQGTPRIDLSRAIDFSVLSGRTAIITGGASGIGHSLACALHEHGARVAVLDLSWPSDSLEIDLMGSKSVKFFRCDVSSWESSLAAFQQVLEWSKGQLDAVITSAGVRSHNIKDLLLDSSAVDRPVKPPSAVFDVNLLGTYYTTYLALWYFTHLKPERTEALVGWKPQLLFLGSLAGYVEQPLSSDYCSSKHGVRGLWKSVRAHGSLFGECQMNMLAPTLINSRQNSAKSRAGGFAALFKLGEVEDVVAGALRCLCDVKVDGRALCCVKGEEGDPGCHNFDLCDNISDLNASVSVLENFRNGVVANLAPS